MVLLARRALQERLTSRSRDGVGGEGVGEGSRVTVLGGRHFPSFSAGDEGLVVKVDREALNCDVLFEGASQAVPVALRHLRLVRPNASATMAAALRSGSVSPISFAGDSKARPGAAEAVGASANPVRWRREEEEWEEIAAAMEAKALADARVEAAEARAAEAERRALALEKQVNQPSGALARAAMAVAAESSPMLPGSCESRADGCRTTYAAISTLNSGVTKSGAEDVLSSSDQVYASGMLLGSTTDGLSIEGGGEPNDEWAALEKLVIGESDRFSQLDGCATGSRGTTSALPSTEVIDLGCEGAFAAARDIAFTFGEGAQAYKAGDPAMSKNSNSAEALCKDDVVRVEALESRLAMLEERHRAELASLRSALEDALIFGRQQEARAASLEERLRSAEQREAITPIRNSLSAPAASINDVLFSFGSERSASLSLSASVPSCRATGGAAAPAASSEAPCLPLPPTPSAPVAPGAVPAAPLSARQKPTWMSSHRSGALPNHLSAAVPWAPQRQALSAVAPVTVPSPRQSTPNGALQPVKLLSSSPSCSTPARQRPSTPTRTSSLLQTVTKEAPITTATTTSSSSFDIQLKQSEAINGTGLSSTRRSLSASVPCRRQQSTGAVAASPRQKFLMATPGSSGKSQLLTTSSMSRLPQSFQSPAGLNSVPSFAALDASTVGA